MDRNIVRNSVKFRWNNIMDEYNRRVSGEKLLTVWREEPFTSG